MQMELDSTEIRGRKEDVLKLKNKLEINKITPLEFLYKEGVKNPLIKEQIEKILRRNTKTQEKKQTGKKVVLSEKKKLLN